MVLSSFCQGSVRVMTEYNYSYIRVLLWFSQVPVRVMAGFCEFCQTYNRVQLEFWQGSTRVLSWFCNGSVMVLER